MRVKTGVRTKNLSVQQVEYDPHECGEALLTNRNEKVLWQSLKLFWRALLFDRERI